MTFLRLAPLLGPAIAWAAARLTVILAFAGGAAVMGMVVGLVVLPVAKDRAYDTGHAAGMARASAEHAAAIDRARAARDDRTARQIEDRIHAETSPPPAPRPDGLRCGPFTRDCPDPPAGSPR